MRDREVRRLLLAHLAQRHAGDSSTRIVEELGVRRGERRVDVAVVNGILAGFEIKSDADDLSRLEEQVRAYGGVFDELTLVCGGRHLERATELVPTWWGIVTVDAGSTPALLTVRDPSSNPARSGYAIAELLWRDELAALLATAGVCEPPALRRRELLELARTLAVDVVADAARRALKARATWRADPRSS